MIYKGVHRTILRRLLVFGTAGAVTATVAVVLATGATAATTLGASAAERGRYFGTAVAASKLGDSNYTTILRPRVQHESRPRTR